MSTETPACARCGGRTNRRPQFPDTFICATSRNRLCGVWSTTYDGNPMFTATVTTKRGYVHWWHGPGHVAMSGLHILAIVRPKGCGWRSGETVYDRENLDVCQPRERYESLIVALEAVGRVA